MVGQRLMGHDGVRYARNFCIIGQARNQGKLSLGVSADFAKVVLYFLIIVVLLEGMLCA